MSLVVLVILAMVWAVFLLPQLFRARAERSTDSIGTFRRQLSVLERTSPAGVARAARLPTAAPSYRPPTTRTAPRSSVTARPRTIASPASSGHRPHPGRSRARKRRHDIFCGLLAVVAASLVLSLVPALRMMIWVHLALDVAFVGYVALLVRARNLATERELKVRFLPTAARPQPQLLLHRSAN